MEGLNMVRVIALALASTALAACATEASPPPVAATPTVPAAEAPAAPKPQYGTVGFDLAGMDRSVLPGDNFYQFANGTWAKNTPIPPDKANYGAFNFLDD
jgi:putative endopeptidase